MLPVQVGSRSFENPYQYLQGPVELASKYGDLSSVPQRAPIDCRGLRSLVLMESGINIPHNYLMEESIRDRLGLFKDVPDPADLQQGDTLFLWRSKRGASDLRHAHCVPVIKRDEKGPILLQHDFKSIMPQQVRLEWLLNHPRYSGIIAIRRPKPQQFFGQEPPFADALY